MKRTRRLQRRGALRRHRKPVTVDASRIAWKTPRKGCCAVCGARGVIVRHHILYERKIREAGRADVVWDLRDALDVGGQETCSCHADHHRALRDGRPWRIPRVLVSLEAERFAVDVLGEGPAGVFLARYYGSAA